MMLNTRPHWRRTGNVRPLRFHIDILLKGNVLVPVTDRLTRLVINLPAGLNFIRNTMAGFVKFTFAFAVCMAMLACLFYLFKTRNILVENTFSSTLRTFYDGIRWNSLKTVAVEAYYYKPRILNVTGRMFSPSIPLKTPRYFVDLDTYDVTNFTFVTGADPSHFVESMDAIAGFQQLFPEHRIVYYDLGLNRSDAVKLKEWCNVEYRTFDYKKYPPHVKKLTHYSFKGIIVYEMLQEVEAIFWIDASIRPLENNISKWTRVFDVVRRGGIVLFDRTGTNIYNFTHPEMYAYLPADERKLIEMEMLGACAVFILRTEKVYREIIHWHYLCAMTPDCIIPANHTSDCDHANPPETICHRYDQSSMNILVLNYAAYDKSVYHGPTNFIAVKRYPTHLFQLKRCTN